MIETVKKIHFIEIEKDAHYDIVLELEEGEEDVQLACIADNEWGMWLINNISKITEIPVEISTGEMPDDY